MRKWQIIRAAEFRRHVHRHAYAALVLDGSYEEAGDLGRMRVGAGDVLLHDCFNAHLDRFSPAGAVVLNIPISATLQPGIARVKDVDAIVRVAKKDLREAAALLLAELEFVQCRETDWPDELATALTRNPSLRLGEWGRMRGISAWALSRGFKQVFSVSAASFRARARTRLAWKAIRSTGEGLVTVAARLGFSDQAHMSRCVKAMTGEPPLAWRSAFCK